jgi:hypothetical protein
MAKKPAVGGPLRLRFGRGHGFWPECDFGRFCLSPGGAANSVVGRIVAAQQNVTSVTESTLANLAGT